MKKKTARRSPFVIDMRGRDRNPTQAFAEDYPEDFARAMAAKQVSAVPTRKVPAQEDVYPNLTKSAKRAKAEAVYAARNKRVRRAPRQ